MFLHSLTRQLRKSCQIASLKCHLSLASINPINRYIFQRQGRAVLDNLYYQPLFNDKISRYILSRNYCTEKIGSWKSVTFIETLEVQQLDKDDYKKIVIDLVSHMYKSDHTACQNVFHTSTFRSVFFPVYSGEDYTSHCTDIIEYLEHICKLDVFNTFLETLANNLESISIGDQLDIYGGLTLLGIPKTHWVMSQLFCRFSKPECVMSLSELAKLSAIYSRCTRNGLPQLTVILPKLKSQLNAITIQEQGDLKNIALLLRHGKIWIHEYPFIFEKCLQIILDGLNDTGLYKDFDCICQVFCGLFSNTKNRMLVGNDYSRFSPLFVEIFLKLIHLIEPHIEHLTSRQIAEAFTNLKRRMGFFLEYNIPNISSSFFFRLTEHSLKLLRGDLPNKDKLHCFEGIVNDIPFSEQENLLQIISEIIPDADIHTLFKVCSVMLPHIHLESPVLISVRDQLLKQWNDYTSADVYLTYLIVQFLQIFSISHGFNILMPQFKPFITRTINSGYGCVNFMFSKACASLIPVLGRNISPNAKTKIRDMVLSMRDLNNIHNIILGANINESTVIANEIFHLVETTIKNKPLSFTELQKLDLDFTKYSSHRNRKNFFTSRFRDLAKEVAFQLEAFEMNWSVFQQFLIMKHHVVVTENSANKMLEYYADQFNSVLVKSLNPLFALWKMVCNFYYLSRLPRKKDKLEEISRQTFDMYSHDMPFTYSYRILLFLTNLEIYLDEHIRKVFSMEYLERLDAFLQDEMIPETKKLSILNAFCHLNAEVVLLRPDLNIPWISDDIVKKNYLKPQGNLGEDLFREFSFYLADILDGFDFFKRRAVTEYAQSVDFEFYLNSDNVPVDYETAKKMDISRTDIQKVALHVRRNKSWEILANDPYCISAHDTHKIRILEASGYRVVYVPRHEWDPMCDASREFKKNYLERKIFSQ